MNTILKIYLAAWAFGTPFAFAGGSPPVTQALGWKPSAPIAYSPGVPGAIGPWTNEVAFSQDSTFVAYFGAGGEAGVIRVSDLQTIRHDRENSLFNWRSHISFGSDLQNLLVVGASRIGLWNVVENKVTQKDLFETIKEFGKQHGHPGYFHLIDTIAMNPTGNSFITMSPGGMAGDAILWKYPDLIPIRFVEVESVRHFSKATYDPSGHFLIVGNSHISIIDLDKNMIARELYPTGAESPIKQLDGIAASGNGEHTCVAVAYNFSSFPETNVPTVDILDLSTGKQKLHLEFKDLHSSSERSSPISIDGNCKTVLVRGFDQAKLIGIESGRGLATFSEQLSDSKQEENQHTLSAAALSKDGKTVVLAYRKVMLFKKDSSDE